MTAPPHSPAPPARTPSDRALVGVVVAALVALWLLTPLRTLLDRRQLAALGHAFASSPAAPALVLAVFVGGGLVLFPLDPLLATTALVFPPGKAFVLGLTGALASSLVLYPVGRVVGRRWPGWLERPRVAPIRARLRRRGVLAITIVRLIPVGSFSLSNIVAAAIGIPFRDYVLGNVLGLAPMMLVLTGLGQVARALGWAVP
ncbi:MAG TPA: VTT domain-containing protein [Polyangia bacterium]|jgi:phospholipase D1/2|nr:VTT domain-containing protein [Polyangia bacterium]